MDGELVVVGKDVLHEIDALLQHGHRHDKELLQLGGLVVEHCCGGGLREGLDVLG